MALGWGGAVTLALSAQAADQVAKGKEVYDEGKVGRALLGPNANLGCYGTARGLFDYTRKIMPIDAPGRLLESEYWAVLAHILTQNGILPPGTTRTKSGSRRRRRKRGNAVAGIVAGLSPSRCGVLRLRARGTMARLA